MDQTISDILSFVEENDIKFIKLQFCDLFGELKNIAILSSELERAFTKGISFDGSSIRGFVEVNDSDLFLVPDPSTITILPWRPQEGRVARFFCTIKTPDGNIFEGDCRSKLRKTIEELQDYDYTVKVGPESEFYLFKTDDEANPLLEPQDNAGYFAVAPFDKGENIRREICLTLEEMGFTPESSHHESGPGQNEIDFRFDNPVESADNFITLKSVVRSIASLNGLYATFVPKPLTDKSGSGFHINLSLYKGEKNIFKVDNGHSKEAESFIAGILDRIEEITAILNPSVNSYRRLGNHEAPTFIGWSHKNRSTIIRIPASVGECARMELRSADCLCNPYLAFTLLIKAGVEGIREEKTLSKPITFNAFLRNEGDKRLPLTFEEALLNLKNSIFARDVLGDFVLDRYIRAKEEELEVYKSIEPEDNEISNWEKENYFYRY